MAARTWILTTSALQNLLTDATCTSVICQPGNTIYEIVSGQSNNGKFHTNSSATNGGNVLGTTTYSTIVLNVTGSWTGSVDFQGSTDNGVTWVAINGTNTYDKTVVSSVSATGQWKLNFKGYNKIRAFLNWSSGGPVTVQWVGFTTAAAPTVNAKINCTHYGMVSWKSYFDIDHCVDDQPSYIKAGLYDDEDWIPTPKVEQMNAKAWYALAGQRLQKGLNKQIAVGAPARDLANVWTATRNPITQPFLDMGIYAAGAAYYDVMDIQSQRNLPRSPYTDLGTQFKLMIDTGVSQISGVNPNCQILAGLFVQQSDTDYAATNGYSAMQAMITSMATYAINAGCTGFWVNQNGQNAACIAMVQALVGV